MFRVDRVISWHMSVEHLEETNKFYREILGAGEAKELEVQERPAGNVTIARLDLGGTDLSLFKWSDGLRPRWTHHTFEVNRPGGPEEVRSRLESLGVAVEKEVRPGPYVGGYSLTVRDPEGNRLVLHVPPPRTINETHR